MGYLEKWVIVGCISISMFFGNPFGSVVSGQEQVDVEEIGQLEVDQILNEAVLPFIHALQTGDVLTLERLIDGKLAMTLGKLLRQNSEYPTFLRQRYGGTTVRDTIHIFHRRNVTNSGLVQEGGQRVAVVHMQTFDGNQKDFQLSLEKNQQGAWKVTDKKMLR